MWQKLAVRDVEGQNLAGHLIRKGIEQLVLRA